MAAVIKFARIILEVMIVHVVRIMNYHQMENPAHVRLIVGVCMNINYQYLLISNCLLSIG